METLSREQMEQRRLEAAKKLVEGVRPSRVAIMFGVSRTSASRWRRAISSGGADSLKKHVPSGRPSRLSVEQQAQVATWVELGPAPFSKPEKRWTADGLAEIIEKRFGIRYNRDYVRRLAVRVQNAHSHSQGENVPRGQTC